MSSKPINPTLAEQVLDQAHQTLPAGGFGNFDPGVVISYGKGSRVWDIHGTEYVDFLIGSGPMLVGHSHPEVVAVIQEQAARGQTFFTSNPLGIELSGAICNAMACADQVRFVSSGGEADMYAMRLARAFTGRDKVLKFEGGYHGMSGEALMSLFPTEAADLPNAQADSAGIPDAVAREMLIAPYNDLDYVERLVAEHGQDIACILVEPLQRIVPPAPGFLAGLRALSDRAGIVLVFDEVVTGFRLAYGGAQAHYGVVPDLCTLGKIIGGGLPLAAVAGRADIMAHFDKAKVGAKGFTLQIGTLSGNPLASAAGLKTMEILSREGMYERLRANGQRVIDAATRALNEHGIAHQIVGDPVLFDIVFTDQPVTNYRHTISGNAQQAAVFNTELRQRGILKSPTKFYASVSLTEDDLERTERALRGAAEAIAAQHL
ncbi:MAG: aminotransferase class III-fold pyridoxal phosphate-dependent enzyme [Pseudomonadota bacterium]